MKSWSVKDKLCVITGANAGIGKETAVALANAGARVVMVCRSRKRGDDALAEVKRRAPSAAVDLMLCDMASQASIRDFAAAFASAHDRLDVLVNNAGTMFAKRELTVDGIECTFAVNHLGYFLLTRLLLPLIEAAAPARIVNVASAAHKRARLDWNNLQAERSFTSFSAYDRSKLCNIAFTYALARRLDGSGVAVNCLHPGVVSTSFGNSAGLIMRTVIKAARPFLLTSERGAETSIFLASSPTVDGVSGKYFARCRPLRSNHASYDRAGQQRLWKLSSELCALPAE